MTRRAVAGKLKRLEREKSRIETRLGAHSPMGKLPNITGIREHWTALARDLGGINRRASLDRVEAVRAEIGKLLGRIQVGKEPGKAIARLGLLNQGYINRELVVAGVLTS